MADRPGVGGGEEISFPASWKSSSGEGSPRPFFRDISLLTGRLLSVSLFSESPRRWAGGGGGGGGRLHNARWEEGGTKKKKLFDIFSVGESIYLLPFSSSLSLLFFQVADVSPQPQVLIPLLMNIPRSSESR